MDKPLKVLIVDDEKDFTESMAYWFKSKGYTVLTATSGEEALELLKRNIPDILFLDVIMPEMDGVETAKRIRERTRNLPIIMMSAYEKGTVVAEMVREYWIFDFFDKADDFSKAEDLLKSVLRIH